MAGDNGEEAFEALAAALDDLVGEAVREDLAGERRDVHARRLALEDVPEGLEVRVAPPDDRVAQLERGDVRLERGYQTEGSGERGLEFETGKGGTKAGEWGMGTGTGSAIAHVPCTRSRSRYTSSARNLPPRRAPRSVLLMSPAHSQATLLTVRLGIAHLDLQEALRDAVHLLDLFPPWIPIPRVSPER